jgi:hypothetical protein
MCQFVCTEHKEPDNSEVKVTPKFRSLYGKFFFSPFWRLIFWSRFRFFKIMLAPGLNHKEGNFTRNCGSRQWQRTENGISIFYGLKKYIPLCLYTQNNRFKCYQLKRNLLCSIKLSVWVLITIIKSRVKTFAQAKNYSIKPFVVSCKILKGACGRNNGILQLQRWKNTKKVALIFYPNNTYNSNKLIK